MSSSEIDISVAKSKKSAASTARASINEKPRARYRFSVTRYFSSSFVPVLHYGLGVTYCRAARWKHARRLLLVRLKNTRGSAGRCSYFSEIPTPIGRVSNLIAQALQADKS